MDMLEPCHLKPDTSSKNYLLCIRKVSSR